MRQKNADGSTLSGHGDAAVIIKRRFALDENTAFGSEGEVNLPAAKDGLGSDKTDYVITGIYSANLGVFHADLDLNLSATRLGQVGDGESRMQTAWAASISRPFGERWGVAGELARTLRKGAPSTAQFLLAESYSYSKRFVFDTGTAIGLNHASPGWSVFAGMTMLIGKIN